MADVFFQAAVFDFMLEPIERRMSFLHAVLAKPVALDMKRRVVVDTFEGLCRVWEDGTASCMVSIVHREPQRLSRYLRADVPHDPDMSSYHSLLFPDGDRRYQCFALLLEYSRAVLPDELNPFPRIGEGTGRRLDQAFAVRDRLTGRTAAAEPLWTFYPDGHAFWRYPRAEDFYIEYLARVDEPLGAFPQALQEMQALARD